MDITKRKKAEKELEKLKKEKELILNTIPERVLYLDTNLEVIWANTKAPEESEGSEKVEEKGYCYEYWLDKSEPCEECPSQKALETGKKRENEIFTPEGEIWMIRASPIKRNGEIVGVVEVAAEVTERKKQKENRLKQKMIYSTSEIITSSIISKYEIDITAPALGLQKSLDYMANLSTEPSHPKSTYDFIINGVMKIFDEKNMKVRESEIREIISPQIHNFLKNIFTISQEFHEEIPPEYKELASELASNE